MKLTVFNIDKKQYALDVSQICEVVRFTEITPICDAAEFVEGVIKLRDNVVPIINLRKRFKCLLRKPTKPDRIIIVRANKNMVGIIVDSIEEVITLQDSEIEPFDLLLQDSKYLTGIAKIDQRLIFVLDIAKLLIKDDVLQLCAQECY